MAIYDFYCDRCKKKFTVVRSIKDYDPKRIQCPKCKSKKVERLWGQVYAVTSKKS